MTPSSPRRQASRKSSFPSPSRYSVHRTRSDHATAPRRSRFRSERGSPVRSRPSSQSRSKRKTDAGNRSPRDADLGRVQSGGTAAGGRGSWSARRRRSRRPRRRGRPAGAGPPRKAAATSGNIPSCGLSLRLRRVTSPAVEPGEDAEPVELRLEDPPRVVERPVHERGRHRPVLGRGDRARGSSSYGPSGHAALTSRVRCPRPVAPLQRRGPGSRPFASRAAVAPGDGTLSRFSPVSSHPCLRSGAATGVVGPSCVDKVVAPRGPVARFCADGPDAPPWRNALQSAGLNGARHREMAHGYEMRTVGGQVLRIDNHHKLKSRTLLNSVLLPLQQVALRCGKGSTSQLASSIRLG